MRVALADDSALFRAGLAGLLETAGIEVVAQARDPRQLIGLLAETPIDVAILDIRMPPTFTDEGVRLAETIWADHPDVNVLVLSTYAQTDYALRLLAADGRGAGYLLKDRVDDIDTLVDALQRLQNGESVIDPDVVARLLRRHRRTSELDRLTEREQAILRLMAEGRSNAGIGAELFLSARTVETHAAAVFRKLGLHHEAANNRRVLAVLTWLRATGYDTT